MKPPKHLQLMHVSALIPDAALRPVLQALQDAKALNVETRLFEAEEEPKPFNTLDQVSWLVQQIKSEVKAVSLKEGWLAQNFTMQALYPALTRAVNANRLRKTKPGYYAPVESKE